jgi:hypothetical protein
MYASEVAMTEMHAQPIHAILPQDAQLNRWYAMTEMRAQPIHAIQRQDAQLNR